MSKSILDKDFVYVHSSKTSADYLRERFKYHREQAEKRKQEQEAKVSTIKPRVKVKA